MNTGVDDPFGIEADPAFAFSSPALSLIEAQREMRRLSPQYGDLVVRAIRVARHKPGRRCLIEYDVTHETEQTWIGKVRAKGADHKTFALMKELRNSGFDESSADGVLVPEPIGVVPSFHMWLQQKVDGTSALQALARTKSPWLARRIASALHKLHNCELPADRAHSLSDEIRILADRLTEFTACFPQWAQRIDWVREICTQLAQELVIPPKCGIHRDFHPDQVQVSGERIYLLDFDLYCGGDPMLDAGNFLAHLTEFAVRSPRLAPALDSASLAFADQFLEHAVDREPVSLLTWSLLSMVRLLGLCVRYPDRRPHARRLLDACEACLTPLTRQVALAT